ncbi:unnamed protein product [Boreogadus saida]
MSAPEIVNGMEWKYFKLSPKRKGVVICTPCQMELAYHKNTTAMLEHLKRRHPIVTRRDGDNCKTKKQRTLPSCLGKETQCTPQ